MGVLDYSKTAASNTTIEAISVAIGAMPPSNVGPLFRALAAALKKWQEDTGGGVTTTGSADAYLLDVNSNPYSGAATFADGDAFSFVANFTNTGAATLNVESEGVKAIRKITSSGEVALAAGDITANGHYVVEYDASANSAAGAWILLTPPDVSTVTATVACSDETTAITATAGKAEFCFTYAVTVTAVAASLTTAQVSGSIFTVDINESGTTILSTKLTIDNTEKTSSTAAAAAVISDTAIAAFAPVSIDVDQIGNGTAKGLKVYMTVRRA